MTQHELTVFDAHDFVVVSGANLGDCIAEAGHNVLDDVFALKEGAPQKRLMLSPSANPLRHHVNAKSENGCTGATVFLDSVVTLMAVDGTTHEAIILVETEKGMVAATYLLPVHTMLPDQDLTLIKQDKSHVAECFATLACVSFARGTNLLMADGQQRPIEDIKCGDRVLTRDHGPQAVRWVGQQTTRGTGEFAPILIRKGTFGNHRDLTLSPNHRLFIYQRTDQLGTGRSEVMVQARMLVDGHNVRQLGDGFVDYYQLLFDQHEIIYAECIATESLMADPVVRPVLPADLGRGLASHHARPTPINAVEFSGSEGQTSIVSLIQKASAG